MKTEIKVTKIGSKFHSRLFIEDKLFDEMACILKEDIGWISREMLRLADKYGYSNNHTSSARQRQKSAPQGKVYYRKSLK